MQELMGHKTIAMTCRYAHLAPAEHQLEMVRLLGGWGSTKPGQDFAVAGVQTDTGRDNNGFYGPGASLPGQRQVAVQ
ncbi:MAG: hypothetical protein ACRD1C_08955 [Terriglobales bacterium]